MIISSGERRRGVHCFFTLYIVAAIGERSTFGEETISAPRVQSFFNRLMAEMEK